MPALAPPPPGSHTAIAPRGVSFVVPVYQSERSLDALMERLVPVARGLGDPYEILLVDDGSTDGSWEVIRRLAARDPAVRGFRLMRNFGQHNALLCGVREATLPVVVTLDDDLQNPPEEVPALLAALEGRIDVVYGTPRSQAHSAHRVWFSRFTKWMLSRALGADTARNISAFRAFRTALREVFAEFSSPYVNLDVMLSWATRGFTSIPVRHDPRDAGRSNYNLRRLLLHAFNMLTGFSTVPLRLASAMGFLFTAFGFLLLVYVLGVWLVRGSAVPGFAFLASAIAIFAGAQMFALGVMGEYIARIHQRSLAMPSYHVGERAGAVWSGDAPAPAR